MDKIVIGIDFGTTFSGVAWAHSGTPETIEFVTNWEAAFNKSGDTAKTPTRLYLDENNEVVNWGYGNVNGAKAICWFKLLLLDDCDVPADIAASSHFAEVKKAQETTGKSGVQFIASYLGKLWEHSIRAIKRAEGAHVVEQCDLRVIITVPADWRPYTRERIRKAVKLAGIHDSPDTGDVTVGILSEPEAAALATLRDMGKKATVKIGDNIVICDAGGGTVDLISYTVVGTGPFSIKECVKGIGGLCGALFLDSQFLESVQKKLGNKACFSTDLALNAAFMEREWESGAKLCFRNEPGKPWFVEVPTSTARCKRTRALQFSQQEMLKIFDPIFKEIESLVMKQVNAVRNLKHVGPKYLVLVGGLGRNEYLCERLEACVDKTTTVLQSTSTKPWTAICRGAVIHGLMAENLSTELSVKVEARIARMSCGIATRSHWVEGEFLDKDKVWDKDWHRWSANNQMVWFLRSGDIMESQSPVCHSFERLLGMQDCPIVEHFLCSYATTPSTRKDHTVQKLCTIKWHTRDLDEVLPYWENPVGKVFKKLDFEIQMTTEGGTVEFSVHYAGQKLGSQHVSVDFS